MEHSQHPTLFSEVAVDVIAICGKPMSMWLSHVRGRGDLCLVCSPVLTVSTGMHKITEVSNDLRPHREPRCIRTDSRPPCFSEDGPRVEFARPRLLGAQQG